MSDLDLVVLDPNKPEDWFLCKAVIDESHACYEAPIPHDCSNLAYNPVEERIAEAYRQLLAAFNEGGPKRRLTDALRDFNNRNRAVFNRQVTRQWSVKVFRVYMAVLDNLGKCLEQKIQLMRCNRLQGGSTYEKCMACIAPLVCSPWFSPSLSFLAFADFLVWWQLAYTPAAVLERMVNHASTT